MSGMLRSWLLGLACVVAAGLALVRAPAQAGARVAAAAPKAGVPEAHRPPGAVPGDGGPSPVIFPFQQITIHFDHRKHVEGLGVGCASCHGRALDSRSSQEDLLPAPAICDGCHKSDHRDLAAVTGSEPLGDCALCHQGYRPEHGARVARFALPQPNLIFDHAAHARRNIGCAQCHGAVEKVGLATRDQLPRMRGCLDCHGRTGEAQGEARGECATCHLMRGGELRQTFASGTLLPPRWLHDAEHGPGWLERHKAAAGADSRFCASCHAEKFCADCHDGRVRPRAIHPNDFLSLHAAAARQNGASCTSCHHEQSFCLSCHQRAGVAQSSPYAGAAARGRFHPPRFVWTDGPRSAGHHAWEAQRDLNACVSCHVERDCTLCHAASGLPAGGAFAVNPHPAGFRSRCARALRQNARPCLVCHDPADASLSACR